MNCARLYRALSAFLKAFLTISASGRRLSNLVNDLLDFSKLKNQEIVLHTQPISLHALADVVLRNMAPLAKGKNIVLQNNIAASLPPAFGDEDRMQQVLFNLVGNAVKFTEKGSVTLEALTEKDCLKMLIKDTGIGITPDKKDVIFREFEQVEDSNDRIAGGTGLGLPITKRLVELHGGTIGFDSTPGVGTTFWFTLPLAPADAPMVTQGPSITNVSRPQEGRLSTTDRRGGMSTVPIAEAQTDNNSLPDENYRGRILVVDDEPVNQQVLRNYLTQQHYQVVQMMNGEDALNALEKQGPFDLVLLDVMMPRMSGYELCQKIREKYAANELPVIMLTAKNQVSDLVEGLNTGANDYLTKPFSKEEFLARLKTHLNLHKMNTAAGRFVPNAFIRSLGRENITEVNLGDHVEKEVTVLFADIRDYTSLAEQMKPEENFKFVQSFNQRMGPIIQQYGGFVNQYLGDGLMAIFPGEVSAALHAAVDMHRELDLYNEHRKARGRRPIAAGFGLHTGPLIMGIIGDHKRMDAATVADTVNVASRMEGITKYYGSDILLSEVSLQKIPPSDSFHVRYLGKVQVKGKQESTGVYECFDGDLPDVRRKKQQTRPLFEAGLNAYMGQDFEKARQFFNEALVVYPEDKTVRLFLQKTEQCAANGVPEGWNGTEAMYIK
jgi:two-component system, sensor histidine kinase ChiS